MQLTIEQIKRHLNIDDDFKDDDIYLESIAEVSEEYIQKLYGLDFDEEKFKNKGKLPATLRHSILLMCSDLYENRGTVAYTSTSVKYKSTTIQAMKNIMKLWYKNYVG